MEQMPNWLTYFISVSFGLVLGSFVNVIVVRLPKRQSIVQPRSRCSHCEKPIDWYDNIPILSYFLLQGKCRSCKYKISLRYPVIELLTALLFLAVRIRLGWSPALFYREWPFVILLMSITFIDLEHRIIPDSLSLGGLLLGLATGWAVPELGWVRSIGGAAIGFGSFYSLAWIYHKISGRSGLGGGDIKLLAMLGSFLGPAGVFATVFISSIFGSIIGLTWAIVARKKDVMKFSIPFGPFLVIGALYYFLLGDILWFQFMTPM